MIDTKENREPEMWPTDADAAAAIAAVKPPRNPLEDGRDFDTILAGVKP